MFHQTEQSCFLESSLGLRLFFLEFKITDVSFAWIRWKGVPSIRQVLFLRADGSPSRGFNGADFFDEPFFFDGCNSLLHIPNGWRIPGCKERSHDEVIQFLVILA